jgi:hypothetical protein
MAITFSKIATVSVGAGGTSNISFSSIPSSFTDLCIKYSIRDSNAQVYTAMSFQFNGSGGTAYSYITVEGTGGSTTSPAQSGLDRTFGVFTGNGTNSTSNTFANGELYIANYSGSNQKSMSLDAVTENNATTAYATINASLWANTAAISSIVIACSTTISQHSSATLYGIKKS